jgi:hypothetical protein
MLHQYNAPHSNIVYPPLMTIIEDFMFLLGGYDLEMLEIRKLLNGVKNSVSPEFIVDYRDRNLQWGAGLSNYSADIKELKSKKIVGIELAGDIPVPPNYICIDHHGERSAMPSSIEQVAQLLNVTLTRYQILVAINDRSYITGLMEYGASSEEIAEIRRKDREAQGVTISDEQLAKQSIRDHLTNESGITLVKSLTSRFSAVTDRLYPYTRLLVYTDHELTYYGENAHRLAVEFKELIDERKAYCGGGEHGFFGIAHDSLNFTELLNLKNEMVLILAKNK